MSTRAAIFIEGLRAVKVYKHWDGNPEATLPWLRAFNADFAAERPDDPEYKFAQLLRSSERDASKYDLDRSIHTGWGVIVADRDYGEEFTYVLKKDGTVTVSEGSLSSIEDALNTTADDEALKSAAIF